MQPELAGSRAVVRTDAWPSLSAEDRLAHVVEASPTALVLTGRSGRIEMVNHRAEHLFGYERAEMLDQPLELLLPERFRRRHVELRQRFLSNMSSRIMGEGRELFGLRKDGSEFPLEIGLNPIDVDGEPMVLAGIVDVTARREIEREKEQQRRELERSNTDLEEFAYAASHDLKAPLRAIAHLVQWIVDDVEATVRPETLENLKLLQGRAARLQMLLDGLLAYSRVGSAHTVAERVDIAEVVREVATMLAPPPGFTIACEGEMPVLYIQRMPIRVVLENLIGNGLKHHDRWVGRDRCEGRVTVAVRQADGMAEFRVSDDGPGILPRFHDRIFLIFQTLASRDDVESSGIGLAIVKKKIISNGGKIRVESEPPRRGTTFVFTWKVGAA
jgi:PAS domain S-box-containing protein